MPNNPNNINMICAKLAIIGIHMYPRKSKMRRSTVAICMGKNKVKKEWFNSSTQQLQTHSDSSDCNPGKNGWDTLSDLGEKETPSPDAMLIRVMLSEALPDPATLIWWGLGKIRPKKINCLIVHFRPTLKSLPTEKVFFFFFFFF